MIIKRRLQGVPVPMLAKEFNLSEPKITQRIRYAKEAGILEDIRQRVIDELLGPAVDAMRMALEEGNVDAAKAILFGTGVLQKNPKAPTATVEMTLKEWRESKEKISIREEINEAFSANQHQIQDGHVVAELSDPEPPRRESEGDDPERE